MKKAIFVGNVGQDADFKTDATGNTFATFSVGISVGTKEKPKTDWVEVICGDKQLAIAKLIKQGYKVLVEGFPTVSAYLNKENKPTASLKLYAHYIDILVFKSEIKTANHTNEVTATKPQQEAV